MKKSVARLLVAGTLTAAACGALACGSAGNESPDAGSSSGGPVTTSSGGPSASSGSGGTAGSSSSGIGGHPGSGSDGGSASSSSSGSGGAASSSSSSGSGITADGGKSSSSSSSSSGSGGTLDGGKSSSSSSSSSSGAGSSSSSGGSSSSSGGSSSGGPCGAGDTNLPPEPVDPPICTTLTATRSTPDETAALDTARIQAALNSCGAGKAVKLTSSGANNAFVTAKLTITGTTLMVDAGTTLYASRNPSLYGCTASVTAAANSCGAVITVTGAKAGIVGPGTIDGQGDELIIGQTQSWWDISDALLATNGSSANPTLIQVSNATNFVMHEIHIFNSPKFHVGLSSAGFIVWGVEIMSPSKPTNSVGTALTSLAARNTDGIDPDGTNGFVVCSKISVGDDQIAIKGGNAMDSNLTIAHNNFGTGHGMSIGSETNAGVSNVNVYDLTIDGSLPTGGAPASDINGLRIKSDQSRGGLVNKVTYSNICVRDLDNPILLNPHYSVATGTLIPLFTNISITDFHAMTSGVPQTVTLEGFDSAHISTATLSNVVVDGTPTIVAEDATITIGAGGISFPPPTGTGVTVTGSQGTTTPIDCSTRWVTFP